MESLLKRSLSLVAYVTWVEDNQAKPLLSRQNVGSWKVEVKLVERDVQCVWLKAGQEFFIGDIYSVSEASTTIASGL